MISPPAAARPGRRAAAAAGTTAGVAALAVALYFLSRANYLLFHSLIEVSSVAVAAGVFFLVWNTRRYGTPSPLVLLGSAQLAVSVIQLLHALAYKGMGVFPGATGANFATQLWIAARGLEAASMLAFALLLRRKVPSVPALAASLAAAALLLASIFALPVFPACYVDGMGLTAFKKTAEYGVAGVLAVSMLLLVRRRSHLPAAVRRPMIAALAFGIAAEMSFTLYTDVFGIMNVAGHLLRMGVVASLYAGLIRAGLADPASVLFLEVDSRTRRFNAILDAEPSLVLEVDPDGTCTWANKAATDFFGSQVVGRSVPQVHLDAQGYVSLPAAPVPLESMHLRIDGTRRLLSWQAAAIPGSAGMVYVARDVTEERRSQETARSLAAQYSAILATTADGFWMLRRDGTILEVNDAYCRMTGWDRTELEGRHISTVEALESADDTQRHMAAIESAGTARFETRHRRRDGRELALEVSTTWWKDADLFIVFIRDITEARAAARSLQDSLAWNRALFEGSGIPMAVLEPCTGRFLDVNNAAAALLGRDRAQLLAMGTRDVVVDGPGEDGTASLPSNARTRVRLASGETRDLDTFSCAVELGGRSVITSIAIDVTARVEAERHRDITLRVLDTLNRTGGVQDAVDALLHIVKNETGVRAVGIRLGQDGDYVYVASLGFPEDFLRREWSLCARLPDGTIQRRPDGLPQLECTCGLVLSGRPDPSNPLFSPGGSAWTNDSLPFLDVPPEEDPRYHPRNTCITSGYRSVALVPIRSGGTIVGLLHLADPAPDRFSASMIALLEGLAGSIGIAVERRRDQEALRLTAERLTRAQDAAVAGTWEWDLATDTFTGTAVTLRLYGLQGRSRRVSFDEVIAAIHPDDRGLAAAGLRGAVRDAEMFSAEWRLRGADGADRWVLTRGSPQPGADGSPVGYAGIVMDITERRRAQEAAESGERLVRTVFESAPDLLVVKDIDGRYREANGAFLSFMGMRRDQVVGRTDAELFPSEEAESSVRTDQEAMTRFSPITVEEPVTGVRRRWMRITKSALRDARGHCTGILASGHDVSEQRESEDATRLLQAQLQQAQKMEAIGQLAGGVAHDFNNMLAVILGYTEMATASAPRGSPMEAQLREVADATQRSAALTRQLLAFARRQAISPRVLDINDTVASTLKMLRRLIGEHVTLSWRPGAGVGCVMMDPAQVDQVLANLAVNARDAVGDAGSVTISTTRAEVHARDCAARPGARPGPHVVLEVADTGTGMDEATIARVFEPFFTTKPRDRGTGLGLATVHGIVHQNGGFITIDSAPGRGTSFRIWIPSVAAAEDAAGTAAAVSPPTGGSGVVLVVEDEPPLLELARLTLSSLGYTVLAAGSPGAACAVARRHAGPIDLLLTDVVMPGMNGRELRDILARERPGMSCLFMSGYPEDAIAHHGVMEPGIDFIAKPFATRDLAARVAEVVDRARRGRAGGAAAQGATTP